MFAAITPGVCASHSDIIYYVRLEQARAPRPSADVLAGICAALRLTDAEARHLHLLCGTAQRRDGVHRRTVRPSILALLHSLPGTAGIVVSAAFDILAWNDLAAALMEDFGALDPPGRNLARRAFLPGPTDHAPLWGVRDSAQFRLQTVMELRSAVARYPDDPMIAALVVDLDAGSAEFARLWQRNDVQPVPTLTKTFQHPVLGPITVNCDALHIAESDQHLVLYTADRSSRDAETLSFLGTLGSAALSGR